MIERDVSPEVYLQQQISDLIKKELITRNSENKHVINIYRLIPITRGSLPTQTRKIILGYVNLETAECWYAKSIIEPEKFAKPFPYPRENLNILRKAFDH